MSHEPRKGPPLLAPIADRYKPSPADFDRVAAKIHGSLGNAPKAAPSSTSSLVRWIGLSCVALVVVGGVVARRQIGRASDPPAAIATTPAPMEAPVALAPVTATAPQQATESSSTIPVVAIDALPRAAAVPVSATTTTTTKPAPASPAASADDTLAREARLLAEAERAFRRGEDARALSVLDEHAKEFPNGQLKDERIAERVVVLCHAGQIDQAVREGRAFLRNRASDPLARRVALSCVASAPTEPQ